MRPIKGFHSTGFLLVLIWASAGCQGAMMQRHSFPAEWPSGMIWSRPKTAQPAAVPAEGPAVAVEQFTLDTESGTRPAQSTTAQMLTQLMVEKLSQAGVRVSDSNAEYIFKGTIPKLGYTERGGYPRKFYYTSELVYQMVHRSSGTVVWKGNLSQDFEQSVLVNTMTKLPNDPDAPVHVLLDKCISPNWEIIAGDVKKYLKEHPGASAE